jgi:hypothetical protein
VTDIAVTLTFLGAKILKTNSELQPDVQNELNWESSITAGEIGVTAENGVISVENNIMVTY